VTLLDDFFPMETPPGAHSTITRWRKMARQWSVSGVVLSERGPHPQEANPLMVWIWDRDGSTTGTPGAVLISPGGCWVNGFYGQAVNHTQVPCPDTGLVVCRFDPAIQTISFVWRPGAGPGSETQDPDGWWEIPLAYLDGASGTITDLRRFIPLASMAPPITTLPPWLPQGFKTIYTGPPTQVDFDFNGGTAFVASPGAEAWFVGGRHLRCAIYCSPQLLGGQPTISYVAADARGEQARHHHAMVGQDDTYTTSFVVEGVQAGLVLVVGQEPGPAARFPANCCRLTVEDYGTGGPP
jgi:hypothetical protein